jgi:hypothetical protein
VTGGGGRRCAAVVPHVELTATFSSCSYYRKTERRRILVFLDSSFKLLRRPEIDSKKSVPPAYVTWRAGTIRIIIKFQHCQGFLHKNCHVFFTFPFSKRRLKLKLKGQVLQATILFSSTAKHLSDCKTIVNIHEYRMGRSRVEISKCCPFTARIGDHS